jgi:hypothetical protein
LKSHLLTHEKEKKLVCTVDGCQTRFKRRKALLVHLVSSCVTYRFIRSEVARCTGLSVGRN